LLWLGCALCLASGLLAGYALGVAQTRRYHEQIFAALMKRFEDRLLEHLIEKRKWLDSLRPK
jgi:hypothetical protein